VFPTQQPTPPSADTGIAIYKKCVGFYFVRSLCSSLTSVRDPVCMELLKLSF
jgi:hypothetical protein